MKMMLSAKNLVAAAAAMILSASAAFAGSAVVVLDGTHDAVGELSVCASDVVARAAGSLGVRSRSVFEALSEESGRVFAVFEDDEMTNEELSAYLADSPGIKSAMPNGIIRAFSVPNDPQYGDQWGYEYIGMPEAWSVETGKADRYVVVIDSGIDTRHPDLAGRVALEYAKDFHADPARPGTDVTDSNGHGTHVAGTIAAATDNRIGVAGVCWSGVKIIPLKIFGPGGSGPVDAEIAAIDETIRLVKSGVDIAAVNLSIGGYSDLPPAAEAVGEDPDWLAYHTLSSMEKAPLICVAAGNEGFEVGAPAWKDMDISGTKIAKGQYCYPASRIGIDNMIVVAAISQNGDAPDFSNWSSERVDVSAPGDDILSTYMDGTYKKESGTSMATPHVAGAAALIASYRPDLTASQIKDRLRFTADGSTPINRSPNQDPLYAADTSISAHGTINVRAALTATDDQIQDQKAAREAKIKGDLASIDPENIYFFIDGASFGDGMYSAEQSKPLLAGVIAEGVPRASKFIKWTSSDPAAIVAITLLCRRRPQSGAYHRRG